MLTSPSKVKHLISSPKPCMHFFFSICATCPASLVLLNFIIPKILESCHFEFSPLSCSFQLLASNIFLSTLILCSSLNLRDQVSNLYKTTDYYFIILYNLLYSSLDRQSKTKGLWTDRWQPFSELNLFPYFFMQAILIC